LLHHWSITENGCWQTSRTVKCNRQHRLRLTLP